MKDVFDGSKQLGHMIQELDEAVETQQAPEQATPKGWQLPFMVNICIGELSYHWNNYRNELFKQGFPKVLELTPGQRMAQRDVETRTQLALERAKRVGLLIENLEEKYQMASRTSSLLKQVEQGDASFVLYLREFTYKTSYIKSGSMSTQTSFKEREKRIACANAIAPLPLVWVSNPSESGAFDTYVISKVAGEDISYRLQLSDVWESQVEKLIEAAAFILVSNDDMTPGVTREIEMLAQMNRLEHTYFSDPEKAGQFLGKSDCQPIGSAAYENITKASLGKKLAPGSLPQTTCPWLTEEARSNITAQMRAIDHFLRTLKIEVHHDVLLDAYHGLLAGYMVLEQPEPIKSAMDRIAFLLGTLPSEELPIGRKLSTRYSLTADIIFEASLDVPTTEQDLDLVDTNLILFGSYGAVAKKVTASEDVIYMRDETPGKTDGFKVDRALVLLLGQLESVTSMDERIELCRDLLTNEELAMESRGIVYGILGSGFYEMAVAVLQKGVSPFQEPAQQLLVQSIGFYDQAITLNPGEAVNHWNRGYVYEITHQNRKAIIDYTHAIRLDENFYKAYHYRARALSNIGKMEQAQYDLAKYEALKPQ